MANDYGVFTYVGNTVENATNSFLAPAIDAIVGFCAPVAASGIILYFVVMGLLIIGGYVEAPMRDFVLKCAKLGLIAAIALSAPLYTKYAKNTLDGIEEGSRI